MKLYDLLKLATRMFKVRTSRTLLTVFGMGIGISAILFLVSLGFGIQKTLLETITTADSLVSLEVFSQEESHKINAEMFDELRSMPTVAHISPVVAADAQVKLSDLVSDAKSITTDAQYLKLDGKEITVGKELNDDEKDGVVVTNAVAKLFNIPEDQVLEKPIKMSLYLADANGKSSYKALGKEYRVIGMVEGEDPTVYLNIAGVPELETIREYSRIKIKCASSDVLPQVKEKVIGMGFSTSSLSDVVDQANKVFEIIRIILAFFGVIALFVSAIGMFNTMTVTLLERTEEIGIMKSIGASDSNILSMFIFESTIMGFLGGVSGIIIGVIGSKIFNLLINLIAKSMGGEPMTLFYYPGWFLLFILGSATVVGFLTGVIPARRASLINPLDALRYK